MENGPNPPAMSAHIDYSITSTPSFTVRHEDVSRTDLPPRVRGNVLLHFSVAESIGSSARLIGVSRFSLAELETRVNVDSAVSDMLEDLNVVSAPEREQLIQNVATQIHEYVSVLSNELMIHIVPPFTLLTMAIMVAPNQRQLAVAPTPNISSVHEGPESFTNDSVHRYHLELVEGEYDDDEILSLMLRRFPQPEEIRPATAPSPAIQQLRKVKIEDVNYTGEDCCVICLDELQVGVMATEMPCAHLYHTDCIEKWLKQRHTCPLCRFRLPDVDHN